MKPSAYGPFPYSPIIQRPKLTWPKAARIAVCVIPNVEFFALNERVSGSQNPIPDILSWSARDYGNRVGIFRLMNLFDRYGIRATASLNSSLCEHHPEIIEEGCARNWEWVAHNQTNTQRLNAVPADQERAIISGALETIAQATGIRPVGWLGSGLQETWQTLDHLVAEGLEYVADWVNDDQPYVMTADDGRQIISLPYSNEINDKPAYEYRNYTSDEFSGMIKRQFDVLYEEGGTSGRVLSIALHPYLSGVPHRLSALDAALDYICRHDDVWLATGSEIARHFASFIPR